MVRAGAAALVLLTSLHGAAYAYTQSSVGVSGELSFPIVDFRPAGSSAASYSGASSGSAYADIVTGSLGASAVSAAFGTVDATAKIDDTLIFTIAGASADTVTPITFRIHLDGEMGGGLVGLEARYSFTQQLGYYAPAYSRSLSLNAGTIEGDYLGTDCATQGDASDMQAVCVVPVLGASATMSIVTSLRAMAGYGSASNPAYVDYAHTSTLSLSAPDNVSWTSPSGLLLTAGVPEPATWAAMVVGFGLAGAGLRRTRRAAAA